jgi:ABC-2 type transport system permease protein
MIDRRVAAWLLARLWRQHRLALLVMVAGVALFEFVITRVAPLPGQMGFLGGMVALLPPELAAFAQEELVLGSPQGVIAFGYLHPFFLAIFSAWTIRVGAGALAGEIGRGTMDLLAARPAPRWALVLAAWVVSLAGLAAIAAAALAGSAVGLRVRPLGVAVGQIGALPAMAWLLFAGWSSVTLLVSSMRREAGSAIAWASGIIATAFVVEFLGRVWAPIAWARPWSPFTYYRPQDIVRHGVPLADPSGLAALAVLGLAAAMLVFERRDL